MNEHDNNVGRYQNPTALKDEDKYLKFFTKTELVFLTATLIPSVIIVRSAMNSGSFFHLWIAFTLAFLLVGGTFAILKIKVPGRWYLLGCGVPIYVLIWRVVRRAMLPKVVFTKNIQRRDEDK